MSWHCTGEEKESFAGKQLFLAPLAEYPSFEEGLSF